jgi:hypothetical protein
LVGLGHSKTKTLLVAYAYVNVMALGKVLAAEFWSVGVADAL